MADALSLEPLTPEALRDRHAAVLGFARSGVALARFLFDAGARVTVYDVRPMSELAEQAGALEGRPVELRVGPTIDPVEVLADAELVATSPSVSSRYPTTEPRLRAALAAVEAEGRIPVVSEVDLFLRLCPATTIGVTGTKGKTTTASLCAAVLEAGDTPVWLGGNIGRPLIERVPEMRPGDRVVIELSELQIPTLSRGTDVAVYTNITADHLDRHGSLEAYRAVKLRLAELTRERRGTLVINDDDAIVRAIPRPGDRVLRYSRRLVPEGGVGVADGWIASGSGRVMRLDEIPLPGEHSVSNVLAAVAVGVHHGIASRGIAAAIQAFPGVEHRLETVATVDGIRFVNDSQGTQPDAVIAALRAFPPPVVLIAGGREKDVDLGGLAAEVAKRADAVVLMGESAMRFERLFSDAGLERIEHARDMDAAVEVADRLARRAARAAPAATPTVLLSPAAASFDMFTDYAARGQAFKDAVARLAGTRRAGMSA
jgi:UDP-N-acetylmuramoylalanine--D-glutamate ligase